MYSNQTPSNDSLNEPPSNENLPTPSAENRSLHVIVGAGAVGSGTALRLAGAGHLVRIVTRSGTGPDHHNIEPIAADATDVAAMIDLTSGAHALYNCANPPYDRWATDWPPLAASFLAVAEATGARLVTMSNLYGYAPGTSPMKATDELAPPSKKGAIRAAMWADALKAHRTGRLRATELRASDYFGPGLGQTAHLGDRVLPKALAGKSVSVIGDPDAVHSWSYIDDVCATLATLGTDDRSLGRAWHAPTLPPRTARQMIHLICEAAGVSPVTVRAVPAFMLRLAGIFIPAAGELREMLYQFNDAFVIDATDTEDTFGLAATQLQEQIKATVVGYR